MPRLFIFAIGGTGSRVLKSLTLLLGAGVRPRDDWEIVPMIIDPHKQNQDLGRAHSLMQKYQTIHEAVNTVGDKDSFFNTKITTLNEQADGSIGGGVAFAFGLDGVTSKTFSQYIGYSTLPEESKHLANIMFSGTTSSATGSRIPLLDVNMDIGFVGNPNVGSVVLNEFSESAEFQAFGNIFGQDDRIFIISSIFGGTGAAGFPVVLKNIRTAAKNTSLAAKGFLEQSPIGALTVCPYFNIDSSDDSAIQKSHFIQKTKAALRYYQGTVTDELNRMYYLADTHAGSPYKNDPGHGGQKNKAHFIELAGALSIIDFLDATPGQLMDPSTRFKEFSFRNDGSMLRFEDLSDFSIAQLKRKMSQLYLSDRLLKEQMSGSGTQVWYSDIIKDDSSFFSGPFFSGNVMPFLAGYREWLTELENNNRGFKPFHYGAGLDSFLNNDNPPARGLFSSSPKFTDIDDKMSKFSRNNTFGSPEERLIKCLHGGTKEFLKDKFSIE